MEWTCAKEKKVEKIIASSISRNTVGNGHLYWTTKSESDLENYLGS